MMNFFLCEKKVFSREHSFAPVFLYPLCVSNEVVFASIF